MPTKRVIAVSWREPEDDWQASAIQCIWNKLNAAEVDGVVKRRVGSVEEVANLVAAVATEPIELDIIGHGQPGRIGIGDAVLSPSRDSYRPLAAIAGRVRHLRLLGCHVGLVGAPVAEEAGPVLQLALAHFLSAPVSASLGPLAAYDFDAAGLKVECERRLNEIRFSPLVRLETPYNGRRATEQDSKGAV